MINRRQGKNHFLCVVFLAGRGGHQTAFGLVEFGVVLELQNRIVQFDLIIAYSLGQLNT